MWTKAKLGDKSVFKLISFFFLGSLLVNSNSIVFVALYMLISPPPVTGGTIGLHFVRPNKACPGHISFALSIESPKLGI